MIEKILPNIDFEGKLVKPTKNGFYLCPYSCGNPSYPRKKWKTEGGFLKHTKECPNRPSVINARKELELKNNEIFKIMEVEAMSNVKHKIGDVVYYIKEVILKPTHVWRGNRQVRVRYEAEKRWDAKSGAITNIICEQFGIIIPSSIEYMINNNIFLVVNNDKIKLSNLFISMQEAERIAKEKTELYRKGCEEAASYR